MMRIVVWNCAMSLHTKWDRLLSLRPDVAIVAECAEPSIFWSRRKCDPQCAVQWVGDNPHKGLGVFAFRGFSIKRDDCYDPRFKQFLPVNVSGDVNFGILAVWAFNGRTRPAINSYGAATMAALDHYQRFLSTKPCVVAGDFNHSKRWDHDGSFSATTSRLGELGLASAYHEHASLPYGAELEPTLFFRKGLLEYHIDYCFVPRSWTTREVIVGKRADWIDTSDHAPVIVTCACEQETAADDGERDSREVPSSFAMLQDR